MTEARDTPGTITGLIVGHVRTQLGASAVERLLQLADDTRPVEEVEDPASWSTREQCLALFDAAAKLTGDERVAFHIGAAALDTALRWPSRMGLFLLGSPRRVLRRLTGSRRQLSRSTRVSLGRAGAGRAVVVLHRHSPSAHDCWFQRGLLTQAPVLFGQPPARVSHPACQADGEHDECVFEVSWPNWSWWRRQPARRHAEARLDAAASQVGALGRAVSTLVASDDLDEILARIAARAAAAIHAPVHLLVARTREGLEIHAEGLPVEQAEGLGRRLLEEGEIDIAGFVGLVAPIATPRRNYGYFAAFQPAGRPFLPGDESHLEGHAGLAAGALEVASALSTARRLGDRNAALVALGRKLAHEHDEQVIARLVAEAMPRIVGAERASVLLWDPVKRHMQTTAVVGFGELTEEAMSFAIPLGATPALGNLVADPRPRRFDRTTSDPFVRTSMEMFGHDLATVAAVVADEEMIGLVLTLSQKTDRPFEDPEREMDAVASVADQAAIAISRLRLLEGAMHAATHDHLTGLADRSLFEDRVERSLADNRRTGLASVVCFLDLDEFKAINDTHGHAVGDAMLVEVATRLRASIRESDTVARLAGDEFAILLRDVRDVEVATRVAITVGDALREPFEVGDVTVAVGVSIGIAIAPEDGETSVELVRQADSAMYEAKQRGVTYRYASPTRQRSIETLDV